MFRVVGDFGVDDSIKVNQWRFPLEELHDKHAGTMFQSSSQYPDGIPFVSITGLKWSIVPASSPQYTQIESFFNILCRAAISASGNVRRVGISALHVSHHNLLTERDRVHLVIRSASVKLNVTHHHEVAKPHLLKKKLLVKVCIFAFWSVWLLWLW